MSDCLDTGVILLSQHYRVTNDTRYVPSWPVRQ